MRQEIFLFIVQYYHCLVLILHKERNATSQKYIASSMKRWSPKWYAVKHRMGALAWFSIGIYQNIVKLHDLFVVSMKLFCGLRRVCGPQFENRWAAH